MPVQIPDLERFSLDVSRDSYRGFPGARKSDSASSDGNGGAGDGEAAHLADIVAQKIGRRSSVGPRNAT